jgi:hypothetical protein
MLAGDVMQALPRAMKDLRGEGVREAPGGPIGGRTDLLAMLAGGVQEASPE